jgi:hypothetical protein
VLAGELMALRALVFEARVLQARVRSAALGLAADLGRLHARAFGSPRM